ncbi:MAG: hypothetical protein HFF09_00645 [Oscillospiraceae bacterium]|nr:hypothetical protein [Oscillospiraceae bacterium]
MKVTRYQLRACAHAAKSFVPYPLRRFVRYGLYVACLLAGLLVGFLIGSHCFHGSFGGVFL